MSFALRTLLVLVMSGALVLSFVLGGIMSSSSRERDSASNSETSAVTCKNYRTSHSIGKPIIVSKQTEIGSELMVRLADEIREVVREELAQVLDTGKNREESEPEWTAEEQDKIDESYDQAEIMFRTALNQRRWSKADDNLFHSYLAQLPRDQQDELLSQLHMAMNNQQLELALAEQY